MRKERLIIIITVLLLIPVFAFAKTDDFIFTDPISNIYTGRAEAEDMIANLNFNDVPHNFWAQDAIVRGGALNLIKGYHNNFNPGASVTNEEVIAFLLRAMNMEALSQDAALRLQNVVPADTPTLALWSLGYLNQALDIGLITQNQFNEALEPDQTLLDPNIHFIRGAPVTREQVADWILRASRSLSWRLCGPWA